MTQAPRRGTLLVALLVVVQALLFVHTIGHEYAAAPPPLHAQCDVCNAAHQLDHSLLSAAPTLALIAALVLASCLTAIGFIVIPARAFLARAPPASVPR